VLGSGNIQIDGGVTSFNTRTGAVTLASSDVTTALGFTPVSQSAVNASISALVDSSPAALDTLNELAAALGDDPNFATTVTSNIASKLSLTGGTLTGASTVSVASWAKWTLETTGTTAKARQGSDANGLNFTSNALWNGSWTEDDSTKKKFAYIQHLGNGRHEFRTAASGAGISWVTGLTVDEAAVNSLVALQQGGNQVLHAGNYNSYALPLGGGTMTGAISFAAGQTWPTFNQNTTGSAASAPLLSALGNYVWSQSTLPNSYNLGIQCAFVGPNAGEGAWQNYGSVMTMRTYSGGGGSLQLYTPYGPANGGTGLQVRFGNYSVSSGNAWTAWKTLLASDNYGEYSTFGQVVIASQAGFQSATFSAGRNRIWSFANSDTYGISYFQGGTDTIGMHFGNTTLASSQFQFAQNGNLTAAGTVTAPIFSGALSGNATTATTSTFVSSPDGDRTAGNKLPTSNPRSVRFDFATAGSVSGASGNYAGVMTYAPWDGTSASTGDSSYQLAFANQSGVNASGPPQLLLRNGINSTWNSWQTILSSSNFSSYAPARVSANRPGVTKLYRTDDDSGYNIQTHWSADVSGYWSLRGFLNDSYHAPAYVALSGRSNRANGNFYIDDNYGNTVVGTYASTRYQGVYAMGDAYKMAADGASLANMYGIAWSHPNAGGAAGNLTDHGMLIINAGGFRCAISNSIVASGNITAYSDERLKTNWRDMPDNYVSRLAKVKVGIYDRIDTENGTQVGVSAQSFQELLPQAITTAKDDMQTLSVNYGGAALASAVELAKDNCELRVRIERLEALINSILNKD
jgi:hypothetical protein